MTGAVLSAPSVDLDDPTECGRAMHELMAELFPICRSITGNGVRETLRLLQRHVPLTIHEVPSGTPAFDWTVPKEWNIRDAYILDARGRKIVDFKQNNLHVVSYSTPVDKVVPLAELQEHLHSREDLPDAIPYVTSYYDERWGFCLSHRQRAALADETYRVVIDSDLSDGSLTYGELLIPGASPKEIFCSTYVCHPSMANNELSGPVVTTFLARWLATMPRRYSVRIVFIPETIGSIVYLSRNLATMKERIVAGFNLTCIGDDRAFSYLPSRNGATLADRAALNVLRNSHPEFVPYSYLERGSDERQYCSPGVDLPVASVMRSKYRIYPEYHTSLDDLRLVTPTGLHGGFAAVRACIELVERNRVYQASCLGEPQLGKRGLYQSLGTKPLHRQITDLLNILAYADGKHDVIDLSNLMGVPAHELYPAIDRLVERGLIAEHCGDA